MKSLNQLQKNDTLQATLHPVSRMDLIRYSGASLDFNPIHTIDEEAIKAGLPGIIAHGMWTMGNLAKLFTPFLEDGFIQVYKVRFSGMVFLNDTITLQAVVSEVTKKFVNFNVNAINQEEKEVVIGYVKFAKYI